MATPSPISRARDQVKALVEASLGVAVDMPLGANEKAAHGDCPRVLWLPLDGVDAPVSGIGGNPRSLGTVAQRIAIECWGEDFDATWQLLFQVRRALHHTLVGSFRFRGHRWLTEQERQAGLNNRGDVARLEIEMLVPIPDATAPTATLTSATHTTAFEGAAGIGCSGS